jgi:O-antigen biosynthesis protein
MQIVTEVRARLPADARRVPVLYDAEAVFSAREILRRDIEGDAMPAMDQSRMIEKEMRLAHAASHVTAVNAREAELFRGAGCRSVSVLGDGLRARPGKREFHDRQGVLFVGAMDDDPSPNVDAIVWFAQQVLPRLGLRLTVAGRCAAPRVQALGGQGVILLGMVDRLEPLYDETRVFVAPHRYAAGIPIKVLDAAARGLPCVMSPLLAEQLGWTDGVEALTAASPEAFAAAVLRLHRDKSLWSALRQRALDAIEEQFSVERFRQSASGAIEASFRS